MKKYILSIIMFAATLSACERDEFNRENQTIPVGEEILFGTQLPENGPDTKTVYGDLVLDNVSGKPVSYQVFWSKNDQISVCCPEAYFPSKPSASGFEKIANFNITPNKKEQHKALHVVKADENVSLHWSEAPSHSFYSVYPAKAVEQTDRYSFFYTVTQNQLVDSANVIHEGNTWIVQPSMDNAIMYAYQKYDANKRPVNGVVDLKFSPISTVLEITVNGPSVSNTDEQFSISKVTVSSVPDADGARKAICGKYKVVIPDGKNPDGTTIEPTAENLTTVPVDNGTASNTITVSTTRTRGIPLSKGDKAIYRVFLAPDLAASDKLAVSVSTPFGTLKKTLSKTEIQQKRVNLVTLPTITRDGANNNWISDLDPNIYLTELSYPGSKLSNITRYQSTTLKQQLADGVRAFIIQSSVNPVDEIQRLVIASENGPVKDPSTGKFVQVEQAIAPISDYLNDHPGEFAIVMFTFCGANSTGGNAAWVEKLMSTCNSMSGQYNIYTGPVDGNTTIKDVAGKIVFKANYNDGMETEFTKHNGPIMLSYWKGSYPQNTTDPNGVPLYWSSTKNPPEMKWFYQEVTTVYDGRESTIPKRKDTDGSLLKPNQNLAEEMYAKKEEYMKNIFEKSIDGYKKGSHDTWFVNDLGGRIVIDQKNIGGPGGLFQKPQKWVEGYDVGVGEKKLAEKLHPIANDLLRKRKENAALGIIFMNFANRNTDGQQYGSDWFIQTIIDNNFKFALRKKPGSTPVPPATKAETVISDDWDR